MTACVRCGSFAINHHLYGRDGTDGDLCDVCYWRKRAGSLSSEIETLKNDTEGRIAALRELQDLLAQLEQAVRGVTLNTLTAEAQAAREYDVKEADADGWIPWDGMERECPVPDGTPVIVKYRNGECKGPFPANKNSVAIGNDAGPAYWRHDNQSNDIIAYSVVKGGA